MIPCRVFSTHVNGSPLSLAVDVLGVLAAKALEKKAHSLEVGRSLSLNYTQTTAGGGSPDGCEFRVCPRCVTR